MNLVGRGDSPISFCTLNLSHHSASVVCMRITLVLILSIYADDDHSLFLPLALQ